MASVNYRGKTVNFDKDGYLANMEDWNEDIALVLASRAGLEDLSSEQLAIIRFMRGYYSKYSAFPNLNYVCKSIDQPRKCVDSQFINPELAWKFAGLPKLSGIHFVSMDGDHFTMEECC
jgi:TusE/DsrC/DsvC family sulfur relay protein